MRKKTGKKKQSYTEHVISLFIAERETVQEEGGGTEAYTKIKEKKIRKKQGGVVCTDGREKDECVRFVFVRSPILACTFPSII